jgi:tRNA pseudouridine55 synthase
LVQKKITRRDLDGVLLLDKPKGLSSNAALQEVKKLYKAQKAGHAGSLDPLADGMLILCFGEATKFCQFLLDANKHYRVTAKLGIKTSTGDAEGEIIQEKSVPLIDRNLIENLLEEFTGVIDQVPSMYSALKHQGQPLYKLARKGITVERKTRQVVIHDMQLINCDAESFSFEVRCSKGTYVRTLVEDMGDKLGCGAHVTELRRLAVGAYQAEHMKTIDELYTLYEAGNFAELDACLLSVDTAVSDFPSLNLSEAAAFYLKRGQPIIVPRAPNDGWVRLKLQCGNFLGVGEILNDGRVAPRRLVQQKIKNVG